MKKFTLRASVLGGLSHYVNQLTPEMKGRVSDDPVEGNRLIMKAVANCDESNKQFLDAERAVFEKFNARFEELKTDAIAKGEGKTPEERMVLLQRAKSIYELEQIEAVKTTEKRPDELVEVTLSDEKLEALKKAFGMTVSQWQNSEAYVEAADALSASVEI